MWQEVVNDDYKNEKEAKRKNDSKPYRQIQSNVASDHPIYYFIVDDINDSSSDKTYYSSDRNLINQKLRNILSDFIRIYRNRGGYKEINQGRGAIAWNFFNTRGSYGMTPIVAVVVSIIWEAQERSPQVIQEVVEKEGLNHFSPK